MNNIIILIFIATASLQDVFVCLVRIRHYFIQCIYLSGSGTEIDGCNYILVGDGGVENKTGYIQRGYGGGQVIEVLTNLQFLYSELVAFSTNGDSLAIRKSLSATSIEECPVDIFTGMNIAILCNKIYVRVIRRPNNWHSHLKWRREH